MKKLLMLILLGSMVMCFATVLPAAEPDLPGTHTGAAADVVGASANVPAADDLKKLATDEPLAARLAGVAGHNGVAINMIWMLICGFLVMFMQAGFALKETGFTRARNAGHTMAMNFMIYAIGMLGYWVCGFALQTGGGGDIASSGGEFAINLIGMDLGLFGTKGFFLTTGAYDTVIFPLFLFQMVLMNIAATIPTGAMAERWAFKPFIVYGFFISMLIYPLYANWVWGGGWLSQLGKYFNLGHGALDFAGSSVVHMTGGVAALAGAMVLGPRLGKFKNNGEPNAMPGHHIPMALTGCLILAFGWFGFNAGSTLSGGDLRIGVIAVNTMLASAAGAFSSMLYTWTFYGKPDISIMANGCLSGLVAITAPCAFVNSVFAVIIGLIAGAAFCMSAFFIERVMKVDDPVGAISVHGANGAWGMLALGLFADGTYGNGLNGVDNTVRGIFYGSASQFMAQIVAVITNAVFVFTTMFVFFKILDKIIPLRVAHDIEVEGLDRTEVTVTAYSNLGIHKTQI